MLVAVSGGPDSTALLLVLQELRSELKLSLAVFHLNHMLREDAERDEAFVRELSERLSLRCLPSARTWERSQGLKRFPLRRREERFATG